MADWSMVPYVLITNHYLAKSLSILQDGGFFYIKGVLYGELK